MSTISKTKMVVSFDLAATFSYLSKIAHLLHVAFSSPFLAIKKILRWIWIVPPSTVKRLLPKNGRNSYDILHGKRFTKIVDYSVVYFFSKNFTSKVSKVQKQIFLFSFEPKNEQNYFLNSALASKMSQIKKMKALYYINYGVFNTIEALIFLNDPF